MSVWMRFYKYRSQTGQDVSLLTQAILMAKPSGKAIRFYKFLQVPESNRLKFWHLLTGVYTEKKMEWRGIVRLLYLGSIASCARQ